MGKKIGLAIPTQSNESGTILPFNEEVIARKNLLLKIEGKVGVLKILQGITVGEKPVELGGSKVSGIENEIKVIIDEIRSVLENADFNKKQNKEHIDLMMNIIITSSPEEEINFLKAKFEKIIN